MEMDHVDALMLEPFDLHTSETLCHSSPNDYLSSNFKLCSSNYNEMHLSDEKNEGDVDALWTKAVDNMFKSSRLFNGCAKEEEKENLASNVKDNDGDEKTFEETDSLNQIESGKEHLSIFDMTKTKIENKIENPTFQRQLNDIKSDKITRAVEDQIVPVNKASVRKQRKRNHSDMDVNFDLIISTHLPPSVQYENKKAKFDRTENSDILYDTDLHDRWSAPPKNCVVAEYNFDSSARLPSFREAFVPAIKKITKREKELKRNLKNREIARDKQVLQNREHRLEKATPVVRHGKSEFEDRRFGDDAGDALRESTKHSTELLSEFSEGQQYKATNEKRIKTMQDTTAENSSLQHDIIISKVKQEKDQEFMQCTKNSNDNITETPSKILGLNSANLKDIEKNIFTFDEGLEMLELDKDFALQNITESAILNNVNNVIGDQDCDWPFEMSDVSRVHDVSNQQLIGQTVESSAGNIISSKSMMINANNNGLLGSTDVLDTRLQFTSGSNSINCNSLSSFSTARSMNGMNMMHVDPTMHMNVDVMKQEQNGQNTLNMLHQEEHHKNFQSNIGHANQTQIQFHNPNSIDGQMIAQQIHQSFGADIFGPPGDNGAKILAKYLAQRGSLRSGDCEGNMNTTSAIASLISKSFDEQEATHKLSQRDNIENIHFMNNAELEPLDFINEQF